MRCKFCGSNKISSQEVAQAGYSYKKGFLGRLFFGRGGEVAGVGGKTELVKIYKCEACGRSGGEKDVLMGLSLQWAIDDAIRDGNVEKLKKYRNDYYNIEWNNEVSVNSKIVSKISSDDDFKIISDGILERYKGKAPHAIIPNSVTAIGEYAFVDCKSLENVTIGNGVLSIGKSAFYGCPNLKEVIIGNHVISIGDRAFYRCPSIENITLPNSVTQINEDAFRFCTGLTSVTIPDSVTYIGLRAFSACDNLGSAIFENASGWEDYGEPIDETELSDPTIAAMYLKEKCIGAWSRKEK